MYKHRIMDLQLFAAPANTTVASDLAPGISIDMISRINTNILELQQVLGIGEMEVMAAGTAIKVYKLTQVNTPSQVGEGETIALTEIKRELAKAIDLTLKKYRKNTTAEAIQKSGREIAINQTDDKLISGIQKEIKQAFYTMLATGTGTASGSGLQGALAVAWGKIQKFYVDEDASPIFFVSSDDVASYLAGAQITLQTAFGMSYVENFLGLGTLVVTPTLSAGTLIATARENLHGAYAPANSGDVAQSFGLTADATGLIGVTHVPKSDTATIDTLVLSGVVFYPELLDGVFVTTINGTDDLDTGLEPLTVTSAAGTASGTTKITVSPAPSSGNAYKYRVADDGVLPNYNANVRSWAAWDGSADLTVATGKEIVVVECSSDYLAKKAGIATVTAKA